MDTFYATPKAGKSSRGNTCGQLFVSDKGLVFVVPMKRKSEVPLSLKLFAKECVAQMPSSVMLLASKSQRKCEYYVTRLELPFDT